ncbi:MAG TPA: AprI/Inh family metalloprotease inhibitor [Rhizomicrobium sp.]|nr:AprI/Inh family metalloprotease inhibitor [Rhizomicrobium sp.]
MIRIRSFGLLAAAFLASAGVAQAAPVAGAWQVAVGVSDSPCVVTLNADTSETTGTAVAAEGCSVAAARIARWSAAPGKLTLKSANGETIALLNSKGASYVGKQIADSRKVVFNPQTSSVAQSQ